MALDVRTGSFLTGTGALNSTIDVTFDSAMSTAAKAVILFWNGRAGSVDATGRASLYKGQGFFTSTTSRAAAGHTSADTLASSDGGQYHTNAACVFTTDHAGVATGLLDVSALATTGFTLIVDDVLPFDMRVGYIAFGGSDITNTHINYFTEAATTGAYTQTITDPGFQGTIAFFLGAHNNSVPPASSGSLGLTAFGAAVSSTQQAVYNGGQDDASTTMDTQAYAKSGECMAFAPAGAGKVIDARYSFNAWTSTGFSLDVTQDLATPLTRRVHYLVIQGGSWRVDGLTTQTNTTTAITETGFGFTPAGALFVGAGRAESVADTPTTHDILSIGAATSTTNRMALGSSDQDLAANAVVSTGVEFDAAYLHVSTTGTINGLMDIQSFDTDGFTCIMDDADPVASFVWYVAAGNVAGGTTHQGAAVLSGVGTLASVAGVTLAGASALSGVGTVDAAPRLALPGASALAGVGTLASAGRLALPGASALTGVGTLAAAGTVTLAGITGEAVLAGVGTLAAAGRLSLPGATALTGVGSLASVAALALPGAAALSGVGTLASSGRITASGAAALSGVGTLASAPRLTIAGAILLQGIGSIAAQPDGVGPVTHQGVAVLAGAGTLTSAAGVTRPGVAVLAGVGTLASAPRLTLGGSVALLGVGAFAAEARLALPASAALFGVGTLTSSGTVTGLVTPVTVHTFKTQPTMHTFKTQPTMHTFKTQPTMHTFKELP